MDNKWRNLVPEASYIEYWELKRNTCCTCLPAVDFFGFLSERHADIDNESLITRVELFTAQKGRFDFWTDYGVDGAKGKVSAAALTSW